jgi:hypothetical protein
VFAEVHHEVAGLLGSSRGRSDAWSRPGARAATDRSAGGRADPGDRAARPTQALLDKWLQILPGALTDADRAAGYRYECSILQAEFSLTQELDRPVSGRVFFEQVIRDNLDAGRPDQVSLIFDRRLIRLGPRATPGRFRTRVITDGGALPGGDHQPGRTTVRTPPLPRSFICAPAVHRSALDRRRGSADTGPPAFPLWDGGDPAAGQRLKR